MVWRAKEYALWKKIVYVYFSVAAYFLEHLVLVLEVFCDAGDRVSDLRANCVSGLIAFPLMLVLTVMSILLVAILIVISLPIVILVGTILSIWLALVSRL